MDYEQAPQSEQHQQRLTGIEARLTVQEEQAAKLDRPGAPWT
jgi:hypothetical protein